MATKKQPSEPSMNTDFESLVTSIVQIHHEAQKFAAKAVNIGLSLRNWLIGRQIELYERKGLDRAAYGDKLMVTLSEQIAARGWTRCDRRELYRYRQFYLTYPKIVETLSPQSFLASEFAPLLALLPDSQSPIRESVTAKRRMCPRGSAQ